MPRTCVLLILCVAAVTGLRAQTTSVDVIKNESTITYALHHPLHHVEATSRDGWFRVQLDPAKKEIKSVSAQVDVMTFDGGNSNRDSHAMEVIESLKYPDVTFVSTGVTQDADSIAVAGKLTFHGVTREILMKGIAAWEDHKLIVNGGFEISLTEFKVERPALLMVPVDDTLRFSLNAGFALP
jgi:polyisoprenoid-binding protein YceI